MALAIVLRVARGSPPNVRYLGACLALGAMVAAPLVTFVLSYAAAGSIEVSAGQRRDHALGGDGALQTEGRHAVVEAS